MQGTKALFSLGLAGAAALVFAVALQERVTTEVEIEFDGRSAGTGTYSHQLLNDSGIEVSATIRLEEDGETIEIVETYRYDEDGRPVTYSTVIDPDDDPLTLTAEFTGTGVEVSINFMGMAESETIPIPGGGSLENPSVFWFVNTVPEVGESVEYWDFSLNSFEWTEYTITYEGPETITVLGEEFEAHKLIRTGEDGEETEVWVDDEARPIRIISRQADTEVVVTRR